MYLYIIIKMKLEANNRPIKTEDWNKIAEH